MFFVFVFHRFFSKTLSQRRRSEGEKSTVMCNLRHTVKFSFSGQCSSLSYFRKKKEKQKTKNNLKKNEKETLRQIHGSVKFTCGVGNKTLISLNGIPTKSHQMVLIGNPWDETHGARCHVSHLNSISISYLH